MGELEFPSDIARSNNILELGLPTSWYIIFHYLRLITQSMWRYNLIIANAVCIVMILMTEFDILSADNIRSWSTMIMPHLDINLGDQGHCRHVSKGRHISREQLTRNQQALRQGYFHTQSYWDHHLSLFQKFHSLQAVFVMRCIFAFRITNLFSLPIRL